MTLLSKVNCYARFDWEVGAENEKRGGKVQF
jgi:hypothetical protein